MTSGLRLRCGRAANPALVEARSRRRVDFAGSSAGSATARPWLLRQAQSRTFGGRVAANPANPAIPPVICVRRLGHLSLIAPPIRSRDRASVSSFGATWEARLIRATAEATTKAPPRSRPSSNLPDLNSAPTTTTRQIRSPAIPKPLNCDSLRPTLSASFFAAQLLSASSHAASRHTTRLRIRPTQLSPTASPSSSTRRFSVAYS